MTETTPDYAGLIERLEKVEPDTPGEGVTRYYRNPDGPGAAAALRTLLSRAEAAEAERDALAAENERLKEDRARFPDRPDDIGRMIEAHIGNLKAGKKSAEALADKAFDRAFRAEAALAAKDAELARRDMQLEASAKVALDLSAQLAETRKALDALDRMSRGVDWCDQDEQARRWSAARRALAGGKEDG